MRRDQRILASSAAFGLTLSIASVADQILGKTDPLSGAAPIEPALFFALQFALFALFGGVLLGTADLLLDPLRPRRTRFWLVLAPLLLIGFVLGLLAATGWERPITGTEPTWPVLAIAVAAASLTWWSFLPRRGELVADVFR